MNNFKIKILSLHKSRWLNCSYIIQIFQRNNFASIIHKKYKFIIIYKINFTEV